jgi:hypothetical protein
MESKTSIFLHSGFRSGSTWFWNRFRQCPATHAYYEPFHEDKGLLTPALIEVDRANKWNSGHPHLATPYNAEYAGLLRERFGVEGFHDRFAYDSYYANGDDPDQSAYIERLIGHARQLGKVPVLGFVRSFGRVPWLTRQFPGALHIVTLRDPLGQWASIKARLATGNAYFDYRYYLLASVASQTKDYAHWFEEFGLPRASEAVYRVIPLAVRLRLFLRVYLLDMSLALPNADLVVDLNEMSDNPDYRHRMTLDLRKATGMAQLEFEDCAMPHHPALVDEDAKVALREAFELIDRDGWIPHEGTRSRLWQLFAKSSGRLQRKKADSISYDPATEGLLEALRTTD